MSIRLASSSFHTIHDMVWQYNNLFKHAVFETFTMEVHIGISWYLLYLSWIVLWCQSRNSWLLWRKKTQRGSGGARLQGDRALLVVPPSYSLSWNFVPSILVVDPAKFHVLTIFPCYFERKSNPNDRDFLRAYATSPTAFIKAYSAAITVDLKIE